jgi:Do/DeqQ family serine protease
MRLSRLFLPLAALAASLAGAPAAVQAAPAVETPALAQPAPRRVPEDAAAMRLSFAPVVKAVSPAVVNVYARKVVRQQAIDPFFPMFAMPGMTRERVLQSLGSGVVVRSDGVIVTNNHVIEGGSDFMVVLSDRREFPAKLLLADARVDLAVLKIDVGAERLPVLAIDDRSDQQVGDLVLAVGNPFGVGQTVTNGIISALNRAADPSGGEGSSYIQTDAAINPGNSGGALVDMSGDLIGINSFIVSRSGGSSGVGFAIPAALVKRVVESAVGGAHTLVRPWLGTKTDPVTADIGRSLGMSAPSGALVTDLFPGGPAAKAGVKIGDVITGVDGAQVADPANLNYRISTLKAGDAAQVELMRDGKRETVSVRVEAPPAVPAKDEHTLVGANPLSGLTVVNLSPAVADELGADPFVKGGGVLVSQVSDQGYAARMGFQPGDVVRAVNGHEVSTVADLQRLLAQGAPGGLWTLTIERGGQIITARVRG